MTYLTKKGPHKEEIKCAIRVRGWTLVGLSRKWGYSASAVATALNRSWPEIETKLGKLLKKEPSWLWPDRYDQTGNPIKSKQVTKKNSTPPAPHNDRFQEAA